MKKLLSLILALTMILSLAACGFGEPAATEAPKTDAPAAEAPATAEAKELEGEITFWHSFTQGPRMEKIQAAADAFMAEHKEIEVPSIKQPEFLLYAA